MGLVVSIETRLLLGEALDESALFRRTSGVCNDSANLLSKSGNDGTAQFTTHMVDVVLDGSIFG